jgi:hypothetical protein
MPYRDGTTSKTGSELEEAIREPGGGDAQQMYAATTGQEFDIRVGTAATPDTDTNPAFKVTRTFDLDAAAVTGDGVENATSIVGLSVAGSSSQIQALGVAGMAKTSSTDATAFENNATGLYGVGRVTGSGTGVGIGGYAHGRTDSTTGKAVGFEVNVYNGTGTDDAVNPTGFSDSMGLWVNANGPNRCGVGLQIGNGFGTQFETGISFNGQENNSLTGGVAVASIRDDSASQYSLAIRGTHSAAAIDVGTGAGKSVFGAGTPGGYGSTGTVVEVSSDDYVGANPTLWVYSEGATSTPRIHIASQSGTGEIATAAAADGVLTGTAAGDTAIRAVTSGKSIHIGGGTSVIEVTQGDALGFFNDATPATKQTVTGSRGANAALASLLTALAAYGLVTDSTS